MACFSIAVIRHRSAPSSIQTNSHTKTLMGMRRRSHMMGNVIEFLPFLAESRQPRRPRSSPNIRPSSRSLSYSRFTWGRAGFRRRNRRSGKGGRRSRRARPAGPVCARARCCHGLQFHLNCSPSSSVIVSARGSAFLSSLALQRTAARHAFSHIA